MGAEEKQGENARVLRIEGEMTIYRAAELRQVLLDALAPPGDLNIDLSGVTEIDSAGVQLLVAAKKSAQANSTELHLTGHSAEVLEVLEIFNLGGYFGDPIVITSPA
jgi:anti-anti-sigma factor